MIPGTHDPVALSWILRHECLIEALVQMGRMLDRIEWRWP